MKTLSFRDISVEILSNETFKLDSSNDINHCDFVYCDTESADYIPNSKCGVFLKKNDEIISSVILCGVGGVTGVHDH